MSPHGSMNAGDRAHSMHSLNTAVVATASGLLTPRCPTSSWFIVPRSLTAADTSWQVNEEPLISTGVGLTAHPVATNRTHSTADCQMHITGWSLKGISPNPCHKQQLATLVLLTVSREPVFSRERWCFLHFHLQIASLGWLVLFLLGGVYLLFIADIECSVSFGGTDRAQPEGSQQTPSLPVSHSCPISAGRQRNRCRPPGTRPHSSALPPLSL